MRHATVAPLEHCQPRHFTHAKGTLALWLPGSQDTELWQGYVPNNPAVTDLSYLVLRSHQPQAWFAGIWDFATTRKLTEVTLQRHPEYTTLTLCHTEYVRHVMIYQDPTLLPECSILPTSSL